MAIASAKKPTKQNPKARRIEQKKVKFVGWLSSDEEEIERRQKRGLEETFQIEAIEPEHTFFGT